MPDDFVAGVADLPEVVADHGAGAVESVPAVDEGTALAEQAVYEPGGAGQVCVDTVEGDFVGLAQGLLFGYGYAAGVFAVAVEPDDGGEQSGLQECVQVVERGLCGAEVVLVAGNGVRECRHGNAVEFGPGRAAVVVAGLYPGVQNAQAEYVKQEAAHGYKTYLMNRNPRMTAPIQ